MRRPSSRAPRASRSSRSSRSSSSKAQLVAFVSCAFAAASLAGVGVSAASSAGLPRGVAPEDAALYTAPAHGAAWRCLTSGESIPWSAVNDDYCDCADGSDEPGTSACPNSRFYCANEGHLPAFIPSSRVNDGVCDEACCDGSDETNGTVECPDRCAKVGKQYRKKLAEAQNIQRAGSKIRDRYIADAKKNLESTSAEIVKLEVELEVAKEKETRLRAALELAERADRGVIEKKKASPLYATLQQHQEAMNALLDRSSRLTSELQRLTELLDDLSGGYNPNNQDMTVKGVVMDYRKWRRGAGGDAEGAAPVSDDEAAKVERNVQLDNLLDEGGWPAASVKELSERDPLELMEDADFPADEKDSGILYRIHEYLPDAVVPYFEAGVDTLLDLLIKANVIYDVKRTRRAAEEGEPENVSTARAAHQKADDAVHELQQSLAKKRAELTPDVEKWGRENEFRALEGKCVSKDMGEYTYEFCFFGGTKQKPNKPGPTVGLGHFARFEPRDKNVTPADDAFYLRQLYNNGARCWNGPARSSLVDFSCATENALLDVFEAEKCIYAMKVSTPAVCMPLAASPAAADAGSVRHSEL